MVIYIVSRWPSLADWAGFPPPPFCVDVPLNTNQLIQEWIWYDIETDYIFKSGDTFWKFVDILISSIEDTFKNDVCVGQKDWFAKSYNFRVIESGSNTEGNGLEWLREVAIVLKAVV